MNLLYDLYNLTRFKFLDYILPLHNMPSIIYKLVLHIAIFTAPFNAAFYVGMSIMEGKEDIFAELKEKFVPTFERSCLFWLPAQTINFLFMPPVARVVYVGSCSFIWINILCYLKRWKVEEAPQVEGDVKLVKS